MSTPLHHQLRVGRLFHHKVISSAVSGDTPSTSREVELSSIESFSYIEEFEEASTLSHKSCTSGSSINEKFTSGPGVCKRLNSGSSTFKKFTRTRQRPFIIRNMASIFRIELADDTRLLRIPWTSETFKWGNVKYGVLGLTDFIRYLIFMFRLPVAPSWKSFLHCVLLDMIGIRRPPQSSEGKTSSTVRVLIWRRE